MLSFKNTRSTSLLTLPFLLIINYLNAQQTTYFQQQTDYKIEVKLNDKAHYLTGNIEIKYTNNSPDTLSFIYMHLWPNGYKHQKTAFAQQLLDNNRLDFHFAKPEQRGFMDSLSFVINDKPVEYQSTFEQPDIAKIALPTALLPQQSMTIKTPFRVKIPGDFSRLAHVDQAYMLCQWYPKPAVYDQEGWHPMPYLSNGEFYSEFGNFDVSITLPQNYVLAATGDLQTPSEQIFLEEKAAADAKLKFKKLAYTEQDSFPTSSTTMKTVRYTAQKVHDFAWFADKRYYVQKSEVKLSSGKSVNTYALFNNYEADLWANATDYLNRSIRFYSDIVGEYPYSTATAVQGIYQGGDMEYPMITVIGKAYYDAGLDNVIAHEVGHNWFYGILGSNERDHPWMDEGFNSYLDSRYMTKYYSYGTNSEYTAYVQKASNYTDQPIESSSQSLSDANYYVCAYAKPTLSFRYLAMYLGQSEMDRILNAYFEQWQYKHPQPTDVKALFEQEAKQPVAWFFDNLVNTTDHLDYALTHHHCCDQHQKASITIKNTGDFKAPIPVAVWDDDQNNQKRDSLPKYWVNLAPNTDTTLSLATPDRAIFEIDPSHEVPEFSRNNNEIRNYGLLRKGEPTKIMFVADFSHPEKRRINIAPLIGFNRYDGILLGAAIYNLPVPRRKIEYSLLPMFSTFALAPSGMGDLKFHHFTKNNDRLTIGLRLKSFHKRLKESTEERPYRFAERYYKISPFVEFELGKKSDRSTDKHLLLMSHSLILEERGKETRTTTPTATVWSFEGKETTWRSTHRVGYQYQSKKVLLPMDVTTILEYANYDGFAVKEHYLKLTSEAKFRFMYSPLWGIDLRLFGGGFLWHTDRQFGDFPLQLISNNRTDYHYDRHIMGRREFDNVLANQVVLREGGFKTAIEPVVDNGSSNSFIFSINLTSDIPIKFPIRSQFIKLKPFLDLGYYNNTAPSVTINSISDEIFFSGGLMIDLWNGAAGIYLPLIASQNLDQKINTFSRGSFLNRLTFSLNLNRFHIEKLSQAIYEF